MDGCGSIPRRPHLRQVLIPKHSIASNVMANVVSVEWMGAVPLPWWTDCQDHIAGMTDKLEVGNSDLESLQNVFLAKVSLNITMRSHHLNKLASKLGTLATADVLHAWTVPSLGA